MTGVKISALPAVTTALLTDYYPVVQAGVTKKETVSQLVTILNGNLSFLPLSGGTLTGPLYLNDDPITSAQAATKNYVDNVAAGLRNPAANVITSSTSNLTASYNNMAAGVGATLTNSGTQAALVLDGVTVSVSDRVLIKNQSNTFENGIYTVTDTGSVSTNFSLTRATDFNTPSLINATSVIPILQGSINSNTLWLIDSIVTTIGTSPITFIQLGVSFPVSVQNGGTGLTSTTINEILYSSANNVLDGITTLDSAVLVTDEFGVPFMVGAPASTGNVLQSVNGSSAKFSTATYPVSIPANEILFSSSSNVISGISSGNNGVLVTDSAGIPSISVLGQIPGTNNANDADAGNIGEFLSATFMTPAALTSGISQDIGSFVLQPGDYDVWGNANFSASVGADSYHVWVSTISATLPALLVSFLNVSNMASCGLVAPTIRVSIASPTTVYVSVDSNFSSGIVTTTAGIYARRAR